MAPTRLMISHFTIIFLGVGRSPLNDQSAIECVTDCWETHLSQGNDLSGL